MAFDHIFFLLISRHFTTIIHNSQRDWFCLQSSFFLDFHFRPWYSLNTVDLETFAKHTKLNYVPAKRSYPWSKKISNGFILKKKCGVTKNVPKYPISKSFFQMLDIFISLWKKRFATWHVIYGIYRLKCYRTVYKFQSSI